MRRGGAGAAQICGSDCIDRRGKCTSLLWGGQSARLFSERYVSRPARDGFSGLIDRRTTQVDAVPWSKRFVREQARPSRPRWMTRWTRLPNPGGAAPTVGAKSGEVRNAHRRTTRHAGGAFDAYGGRAFTVPVTST